MASIKARLSSVEQFREQSGGDYDSILGIANDLLSRSGKLYTQTQSALDSISSQLSRAQMSHEEIKCKVESYEWNMEDAARDIERYNAEIDFIYNNPKKVTTTDSEGNEITEEVIDYAALSVAQRNRDEAYSTYNHYRDKCNEARPVLRDAEYTVSRFQNIKQGIKIVSDSIQNDIYEIKKYISAIEDEAEYNIQSLDGAIDSLKSYLASKSIFMPDGAIYQDFSSGGGAASTSSGSSGGSVGKGASIGSTKSSTWGDAFTKYIENEAQMKIYENAGLEPSVVNGRSCLIKKIDYDYVDESSGMTNRERMAKGRSPIDPLTGETIELHHMGQGFDSPFAELTADSEHGDGNHKILHPKVSSSWRNDEAKKKEYRKQKMNHWIARSKEFI